MLDEDKNIDVLYMDQGNSNISDEKNNTDNSLNNPNSNNSTTNPTTTNNKIIRSVIIEKKSNSIFLIYFYETPYGFNFLIGPLADADMNRDKEVNYSLTLDEHYNNIQKNGHSVLYDKEKHLFGLYLNSKYSAIDLTLFQIALNLFVDNLKLLSVFYAENALYIGSILLVVSVFAYKNLTDKDGNFDLYIDISDFVNISTKKELLDFTEKYIFKIKLNNKDHNIDLTRQTKFVLKTYDSFQKFREKFKKKLSSLNHLINLIPMENDYASQ